MKCTELEALICDYVDGALSAAEKATVELHLKDCEACRELVNDSLAAVEFMATAAAVEPPPALVNGILYEAHHGKSAPARRKSSRNWFSRLLEPILQPKFAMGMAMTILSLSMLARFAGIPIRQMRPSDMEPAKLWATLEDKTYRTWERARKYYESLRLVYEIQQTLRDWNETAEGQTAGPKQAGVQSPAQAQPGNSALEGPIEVKPQGENQKNRTDGRAKQ